MCKLVEGTPERCCKKCRHRINFRLKYNEVTVNGLKADGWCKVGKLKYNHNTLVCDNFKPLYLNKD